MFVYLQVVFTNKPGPDPGQSNNNPRLLKRRRSESDMTEKIEAKKIKKAKGSDIQKKSSVDFKMRLMALDSKGEHVQHILASTAHMVFALKISTDRVTTCLNHVLSNLADQEKCLKEYRDEVKELAELMKSMDSEN